MVKNAFRVIMILIITQISLSAQSNNYNAGTGSSVGTGNENTVVGYDAGNPNMTFTGNANSFFGQKAGFKNTTGGSNTFIGQGAGINNTSAGGNTFIGKLSGAANTTANSNTFVGLQSGYSNVGGHSNTFIGRESGRKNSMGSSNTMIGYGAGYRNELGKNNLIIGRGAGPTESKPNLDNKLYIDVDTSPSITGNDTPLIYGEFDNHLVRINGEFEVTGGVANSSSRKLKSNFEYVDPAVVLSQIASLSITKWNYNNLPEVTHIGPVAEDFHKKFNVGKSNTIISTIDADGVMMLAIQALKNENDALRARLIEIEKKMN